MVLAPVLCPYCKTDNVQKKGRSTSGQQRYLCCNTDCSRKTFGLDYKHNAYKPGVKEAACEHIMNGTGTRATARLLGISKDTVTRLSKKLSKKLNT